MDTPVISVERMRKSDAYTIEHFTSSKELMYRAVKGVYDSFDDWKDNSIAIVVGGGNNGGDGYALAGILKREGVESTLIQTSQKLSDDGRYYYDIAKEHSVPVKQFDDTIDLSEFDIILDCILGTGFIGEVRGTAKEAIDAINSSKAYVISVDINSGMNGDTGEATFAVNVHFCGMYNPIYNAKFHNKSHFISGICYNICNKAEDKNATVFLSEESDPVVTQKALEIEKTGIKHKDACHIACAIYTGCDYFITTDDRILKYKTDEIKLVNPVDYIREVKV